VARSLAAGLGGAAQGVQLLPVHHVTDPRQALGVWRAVMHEA
jgi:dihydropteroate synthase